MKEPYTIEFANGQKTSVKDIIPGCTLGLADKTYTIDLIPLEMGSFDIVVGMDWLSSHRAEICCFEKIVRIPTPDGETLNVYGEKSGRDFKIISSIKMRKFLRKGNEAFLAHIINKKTSEKNIQEIPVVQDFLEVFPEDLPGLPPNRQVEFHIDLVPGAAPVAKAPYRLAPSEMQELSAQLQELLDKGFIQPSSSPWGAPVLFVK